MQKTMQFPDDDPQTMQSLIHRWCEMLASLPVDRQVNEINSARKEMHLAGPFASEPVDLVLWAKNTLVCANDYNPNTVAPPEMELLRLSITADGYTQPIVSWMNSGLHEVVDGFHRHRVGKECEDVRSRVHGYLPIVSINDGRQDKSDRMASTIRHNRARGKHRVDAMSEIVVELKRRRWSDEKIGKELGMDPDEVLRLTQVSGIADLFADRDFSEAWECDTIEEQIDDE
jgi:ParB-like chromosome segregation protein Spo0J